MRKTRIFALAIAAVFAIGGVAETTPQASAAERPTSASLDKVRADAMTRLAEGDVQEVRGRGRGGAHGGRGGRRFGGGRSYGGNRGYYGRNRSYGRGRYYHRNRGRNVALGVGAAALAIGAVAAANRNGGGNSCARRYRSYDARSGTYLASPGVRRSCP